MKNPQKQTALERKKRAQSIYQSGNIDNALNQDKLEPVIDTTLAEALILGLIRQGVKKYIVVFGHGSTEIGEVLRIYEDVGLIKTYNVRNEISGTHAAMALRWVCGEKAAVVTSIGPGALQAFAGSLAAASDGIGLWFLFGDETTEDEGPNMQQIPGTKQMSFLHMCSALGSSYCLHTPLALPSALRRGLNTVDHPYRGQPFFLLLPLNIQPAPMPEFNLRELPFTPPPIVGPAEDLDRIRSSVSIIKQAKRVVVKLGGGAKTMGKEIISFLDLADAVVVMSPLALGTIPFNHPRNMTVGGSKGSISGNYAMENADCLVTIGSRQVCQADCSRTGYPKVKNVISINADIAAATHYHDTISLVGDGRLTLLRLIRELKKQASAKPPVVSSPWFRSCMKKRREWDQFRSLRYATPKLFDDLWQREVLTQPAAIHAALKWAQSKRRVICFFDAGDVQANGFQIDESDVTNRVFTETGASYMGWAASALLSTGIAEKPFYGLAICGDGSFTMNPQILIDGMQHNAKGCILILDNRRMGAISGLQQAQYNAEHATWDQVNIDYVALTSAIKGVAAFHGGYTPEELTNALTKAYSHPGLSLVTVPVYYGPHELGGMGVFGRWNVGCWVDQTQKMRHIIGL